VFLELLEYLEDLVILAILVFPENYLKDLEVLVFLENRNM
jgi:hypothetical protein